MMFPFYLLFEVFYILFYQEWTVSWIFNPKFSNWIPTVCPDSLSQNWHCLICYLFIFSWIEIEIGTIFLSVFECYTISAWDSADHLSLMSRNVLTLGLTLQYYTNISTITQIIFIFLNLLQLFKFSDSYPKAVNFMRYLNKLQKKLSFMS